MHWLNRSPRQLFEEGYISLSTFYRRENLGAEQWNNLPNFRPNKWVSKPKSEPWKQILQSQPSQFSYFSFLGVGTWIYVFNLKFYAFHNLRVIFLVILLFFSFIISLLGFCNFIRQGWNFLDWVFLSLFSYIFAIYLSYDFYNFTFYITVSH